MPYDYTTSLPAFHENRQRKDKCKEIILTAIKTLEPCTDVVALAKGDVLLPKDDWNRAARF